jgi:hypothetical protein
LRVGVEDPYNDPPAQWAFPHEAGEREGVLSMAWTKPEFKVVAVTLEVTAYAGTKK